MTKAWVAILLLPWACADAGTVPPVVSGANDATFADAGPAIDPDASQADADDLSDAQTHADAQASPDAQANADAAGQSDAQPLSDAGTSTVSPTAACPVETLDHLYPGRFPPNPFGDFPDADACIAAEHDVIVLLGCPTNDDGTASRCQTERVDIGTRLMQAGYGHRFIVTGAAVHNAFVEADALATLLMNAGVPAADIRREPLAEHTDENIYYSTRIMEAEGWTTALVVSESAGHLVMTAVCDANCCVALGRFTVLEFPLPDPTKVGHYVRYPYSPTVSMMECDAIEAPLRAMCTNRSQRRACADGFRL